MYDRKLVNLMRDICEFLKRLLEYSSQALEEEEKKARDGGEQTLISIQGYDLFLILSSYLRTV